MAWLGLLVFCVCLPATFHPCFFMISKPSFKTDFLPFPWYKYMSRNNGHQEREVENYRYDSQKLQMRVLRLQPDLETPLKKPPCRDLSSSRLHSSPLAHKHGSHLMRVGGGPGIPTQWEYMEQYCDPQSPKAMSAQIHILLQ